MAQTELSKQIKRINERINALARKGYMSSEEFEYYASTIVSLPHHELVVKSENPITHQFTPKTILAIDNVKVTEFTDMQLKALNRLDKHKKYSVGGIHARAKKILKDSGVESPTAEEIRVTAFKGATVHEWIRNYAWAIYGYTNSLGEHNLQDAVHRKGPLTDKEIDEIYEKIVMGKAEDIKRYEEVYKKENPDFKL